MHARVLEIKSIELSSRNADLAELIIQAQGTTTTSGWSDGGLIPWSYISPPDDGIQDFDFVAKVPTGPVQDVISKISGKGKILLEEWMRGVRIHSSSNELVRQFAGDLEVQPPPVKAGGEVPWPMVGKIPLDLDSFRKTSE